MEVAIRSSTELVSARGSLNEVSERKRRSGLSAPTMQLTGHEGAIFSISFDSSGQNLCSGSMDRKILLWEVYGECKNYNVLTGHKNAVLDVKWVNSNPQIISTSADKTVALWDANKGTRIRKMTDHTGIVNCCSTALNEPKVFASGSDDCTAITWDTRSRRQVVSLYHDYQVTSVALSPDGGKLYTGSIDNVIRCWDLRNESEPETLFSLQGHTDSITGLSLSPMDGGQSLLSNAMDSSLRSWDVRPFALADSERQNKLFLGSTHGAEKCLLKCAWSPDQRMVCGGSADRVVRVWDSFTGQMLYALGGHKGSVNEVLFHPTEPILASCSSDKTIFLGELGDL